ncbi:related to Low molecular weight phosphotyrosine protein phosphatase [Saccharomycodes ludwigii]|uniref:Related to Low molecular weight phosphotyrosine protein phosphatase n=1 Tax=Saccharomycodes ludwigii TaxID=36035 RepID=A0A376BBI4_9ASCO|nr:hypothetical protein SCDLUD_000586 [Saccharomycodes ludwigii]KAH3902984.1 hypothetical protein SCDLUD_000586 [Saccharomycodes ludwigii]SSD61904.1 related to Low molecular weight phosphotyrosine protein phosphatase [Saccharomycodes ludwigii]
MSTSQNIKKISVAFVCLGNICRSPMAEAVFKHIVQNSPKYKNRFSKIESYGTSAYNLGQTPDSRSVATCHAHDVPVNHIAQQFKGNHFKEFDYIICMDDSNYRNLMDLKKRCHYDNNEKLGKVYKFGHWNSKGSGFPDIIADPYYGGNDGFEFNYRQITLFTKNFLKQELGE